MRQRPFQDVGDRLLWCRSVKGLTQIEFARSLDVPRERYREWERGDAPPSASAEDTLIGRHGLTRDFLYEGKASTLPVELKVAWHATGEG